MSIANPNRIQRGVHAGGQFTTGERSEAQVTLSQAPAGIEPWELAEGIIEGQQWDVDKVADRDRWATKQWEQYCAAYHEADAYHESSLDTAHSAPTEFEGATTATLTSEHDGALVVQIDTDEVASGRTVRVIVNAGAVFDGDPEQHQVARIQHHNPGPGASPDHWQFARDRAMAPTSTPGYRWRGQRRGAGLRGPGLLPRRP